MSRCSLPRLRPVALAFAALISLLWLGACAREVPVATAQAAPAALALPGAEVAPLYVCPMHPHITSHEPGKCPICGMDLVLKKPLKPTPAAAPAANAVVVDAAVLQSLGVRTAPVQRRDLRTVLRVPALVVADAGGEVRLQARVSGFVERLRVRNTGAAITAGSVVAEVYAPELVQAQEELLLGGDAAAPAAERLRRYGIAERDIDAVRAAGTSQRRLPLRAPASGTITSIGVREGSSFDAADVLVEIAGRGGVRVEAQLFPAQRPLLGTPVEADFTQPGVADARWAGRDPQWLDVVDPVTRTLGLRWRVDAGGELALGTVLDAELRGPLRSDVLVVPTAAVIRTTDQARVLREDQRGVFVPVPVHLGARYGDEVEILHGLAAGERIVVSGQFLLDSEAQLRGPQQMEVRSAGHRHD
ncbi:MAG: efflux RND transporter periplasmic adaptor subunit [Xanthomonadales bacterium]|nr:efflux RND transporter periplasmic adaptor subunit [Xanthomonadales bacterium]